VSTPLAAGSVERIAGPESLSTGRDDWRKKYDTAIRQVRMDILRIRSGFR
jgi:hypothetical protein